MSVQLLTNAQVRQKGLSAGQATVLDLLTGRRFNIFWGGPPMTHTDFSPLTPQDTAIMLQNAGGRWNWVARPAVLEIRGFRIAVGIHSFPHGSIIGGNPGLPNMSNVRPPGGWPIGGHFCMWYKDSRSNNGIENQYSRDMRAAAQRAFEISGGGQNMVSQDVNFVINGYEYPNIEGLIWNDRSFAPVGEFVRTLSRLLNVEMKIEWDGSTRTVLIDFDNTSGHVPIFEVLNSATEEQWQRIADILQEVR